MNDDPVYEIEVRIRSRDSEAVRHLEGPLEHHSSEDVAVDIVAHLDSRSRNRIKHVPHTDR